MKKKQKFKLILFFLLLFLLLGANFVLALEINYPPVPGVRAPQDFIKTAPAEEIPSLYVKYLFNLAIWVVGIIAFGVLVYAGIRYLTSVGKPEAISSARNQISAVFFGILILLSSFFILKILNPQLIILEIPDLQPISRPGEMIEPPPTERLRTLINTEIPLGTIIQKGIFEGVRPSWENGERIPRIKQNAEETNKIVNKIRKQNDDLANYTSQCQCFWYVYPDPTCNFHSCAHDCPPRYCTGDPCTSGKSSSGSPRNQIQETENKNLKEIDNLVAEQIKTEEEVRLLKEQLAKLVRAKKFILDCYEWLDSLAAFLIKKDSFIAKGDISRKIRFWDTITIKEDGATFYCPVSGTIFGETEYITMPPGEIEITEVEEIDIGPVEEYSPACSTEVPIGEIIDRTLRTGNLLVTKMEQLVKLEKKMIEAVDKMHILVSQCSSKNCHPVCDCEYGACIEIGCFGIPCPTIEIANQLQEIEKIQQRIKDVIRGKGSNNTPENIGIIPITEKVIPKILEDLDEKVRREMKYCVTDFDPYSPEIPEIVNTLMTCRDSKRGVGPEAPGGKIIQKCCLEEKPFQNCLEKCYLEQGHKKYKECLYRCIETLPEDLNKCRHKLNFYCCQ